ncbi:MAG: molybdate ABC transporter substrate-binding protein [Dehalococcoidales bacterium]|jgi:molybdate transport system substrate-binding protein|nr:molybdate ABC transporter substrate-binding protein [Dehalococcoidales bacterium]MDD4465270.1 molybdate ABC transporter substrate-binding protein [Dehalococcoidales bacterium]MDD5402622.1 molybdate ABC transporter substrate-binding protein [Dehalococcoidales bacterium]
MTKLSRIITAIVTGAALILGLAGCNQSQSIELNISAAASMTDALTEINQIYQDANPGVKILPNFASSGTLQTQIEQGALVDVFISAASKQMNTLESKGLIIEDTRRDLLNNRVVLIVPSDSTLQLNDFSDLSKDAIQKIAMGDPEFVPAGTYGKNALVLLGMYEQIQSKLILGSDVRQVLSYVENGNVDAGIVYSTDAAISDRVKIAADGPDEINSNIVYPVAIIKSTKHVEAAHEYIDFLFSTEAKTVFEKYGFAVLG